MFNYETLWDIYEVKFTIFFITVVLAIVLGNYFYNKKDD